MSSRRTFPSKQVGMTVACGWDNTLQTYFCTVLRRPSSIDEDADPVVLWLGLDRREVRTPEEMAPSLAPYADLDALTIELLRSDLEPWRPREGARGEQRQTYRHQQNEGDEAVVAKHRANCGHLTCPFTSWFAILQRFGAWARRNDTGLACTTLDGSPCPVRGLQTPANPLRTDRDQTPCSCAFSLVTRRRKSRAFRLRRTRMFHAVQFDLSGHHPSPNGPIVPLSRTGTFLDQLGLSDAVRDESVDFSQDPPPPFMQSPKAHIRAQGNALRSSGANPMAASQPQLSAAATTIAEAAMVSNARRLRSTSQITEACISDRDGIAGIFIF